MSHAVECETVLKDLDALERACVAKGFNLVRGQKTYRWYGTWVDDSPVPEDMFPPDELKRIRAMPKEQRQAVMTQAMGKCDHAIRVPGTNYEVGVVRKPDGSYRLRWDYYDASLLSKMGGKNGGVLVQQYSMEVSRRELLKKGYGRIAETRLPNGTVKWVLAK